MIGLCMMRKILLGDTSHWERDEIIKVNEYNYDILF